MSQYPNSTMKITYSGSCGVLRGGSLEGEPENVLLVADLMLSYYLIKNKNQDQHLRLPLITKMKTEPEGVGLFFLDSGAHSLYTKHVIKRKHADGYAFYDTKEFWQYVDAYAGFIKEHHDSIDYYANVDVIFNPKKSWEVLKYLEREHGLFPIPVIHYGTSLEWVHKHLREGYTYLGLGGLGQEATAKAYRSWADGVFEIICPPPNRLPIVKTHGFAMTAYELLKRYPWFSVDSATWTKVGANGCIMVPHKRGKEFTFEIKPYHIIVSNESTTQESGGKHYKALSPNEKKTINEWLDLIEVPFGKTAKDGTIIEYGVTNRHSERKIANLKFFEGLRNWLPPYPWPFKGTANKGFGLC